MAAVELTRQGRVGVITVDNPPVNALSQTVRAGLVEAIEKVDRDAGIEAAVLRCAGRTFIAGADIREFDKPIEPPPLPEVVARIEACEKPLVAALHGTALGGGLEVALGCHYRVAVESARVGLPEVNLGLLPGASGTQRLPRLTGIPKALDIMLSGKPIGAKAALDAGIVDALVTEGDLLADALEYANGLVERGAGPRRIRDLSVEPVEPGFFADFRDKIAPRTRGLIAPEKILLCVEKSLDTPFDEAVAFEREQFLECKASEQSEALRHVFFAERAVAKVPGLPDDTAPREVSSIAVIGAGTMGVGIAYSCLSAGFDVTLLDNNEDGLAAGRKTIEGLYDGGIARGKLTGTDKKAGLSRLSTGAALEKAADVDLVIEAVFENLGIKREVFGRLDEICREGAVLATNTSTLDVDRIAAATNRPADVIGMHFFSPAHVMRLVEIVRGAETAPDVIATALAVSKRFGKLGVVVGNCFGFVGNRMLYGYGREAQLLLLEGAAPEEIDKALTDWGMAMGPHAVGDLAGLDVGYKVRQERENLPDDPRFYRVADLLVELGRYGQKTGKGMYRYEAGSRSPMPDPEVDALIANESAALGVDRREIGADEIVDRCIYALIVEGARILEDGISPRSSDLDVVWTNGYGFPRHRGGPMHYADTVGVASVYESVCEFRDRFGPMYWEPPALLEDLARGGRSFADV
ncbi:MAG TPA: 3-hydroxyacyl-CoA dehydrogenase NAD-binding domain-containing protein [Gammaproteobacteria bacterium]